MENGYVSAECPTIYGRRVYDIDYISSQIDRSSIGVIITSNSNISLSELSDKTGIEIESIIRDSRRIASGRYFRYLSPEAFRKIVEDGELVFTTPNEWPDKCEGYLYHALQEEEGKRRIVEIAKSYGAEDGEVENKLQYVYDNTRCVCFCGSEDSIVMWSAYDNYKSETIMIEISIDELKSDRIMVCPVEYVDDNISLEAEIRKVIKPKGLITHNVYITKRREFSFENETRLFYRAEYPNIIDPSTIKIDTSKFIKNVIVHPTAKDEYEGQIRALCKEYGIKYSGRSKKFDFKWVPSV